MKRLILASQSPGRREALEEAGFVFEIMPSDYEERVDCKLSKNSRNNLIHYKNQRPCFNSFQRAIKRE